MSGKERKKKLLHTMYTYILVQLILCCATIAGSRGNIIITVSFRVLLTVQSSLISAINKNNYFTMKPATNAQNYLHYSVQLIYMYIVHTLNSSFSGTSRVSRYQKGKLNLNFTEARDSEWQCHQLGHMQVCTLLQTDNHASTQPLCFLQAGCSSCRPTNSIKALNGYQKSHRALHMLLHYLVKH